MRIILSTILNICLVLLDKVKENSIISIIDTIKANRDETKS
nr:hypothetical protein [Clostridium felsineum]